MDQPDRTERDWYPAYCSWAQLVKFRSLLVLAGSLVFILTLLLGFGAGQLAPLAKDTLPFNLLAVSFYFLLYWFFIRELTSLKRYRNLGPMKLLRRLHTLPYVAAGAFILLWLLCTGTILLIHSLAYPISRFQAVMGLFAGVLAGWGGALFLLGHLKGPVLLFLDQVPGTFSDSKALEIKGFWRLQNKLAMVLGGLVFFACGLSLFISFAQQKGMVGFYVNREVARVSELLVTVLSESGVNECPDLKEISPYGGGIMACRNQVCCVVGNLEIDEEIQKQVTRANIASTIRVPEQEMEGTVTMHGDWLVAVFVPTANWAEPGISVIIVFFTVLFLFSGVVGAQVARELTLPIADLADKVAAIRSGDLDLEVKPLTIDELGGLAVSVDKTRQEIQHMVRTISDLNVGLEVKVKERTREIEAANQQLLDAMEKLKTAQSSLVQSEKMAALGMVVAGVAHEINNPVNALTNSIEPLRERMDEMMSELSEPSLKAEVMDILGVMENAALRTSQIVQDLKVFSRRDQANWKCVAPDEGIRSTLRVIRHLVARKEINLREELDAGKPVHCLPGQLNQLVMNLVVNALDAVSPGGGILVKSELRDGQVLILVEDDGVGIPAEDLDHIFEPFFTRKTTGTGLGLSIVQQVAALHRGEVECRSELGVGTRFTVRFPAAGGECG